MPNLVDRNSLYQHLKTLSHILLILIIVYALGIIIYNGPASALSSINITLAILWLTLIVFSYRFLKSTRNRTIALTILLLTVYIPYQLIKPSNERDWAPEFAKTAYAEIQGDQITIHNFRNFSYSQDGTITESWTTRTVNLNNLRGIDYFQNDFGGKLMAHPILTFDFGHQGYISLSIETRREKTEHFSPIGGLYKVYELSYILGTETDLIKLRTNIRKDSVYLYRFNFTPDKCREIFLASIKTLNELKEHPRFYHILRANCTTSFSNQASPEDQQALDDWRLLANGQLDKMIDEKGWLHTNNLPFKELRQKSLITPIAQSLKDDQTFSKKIREKNPAFTF